MENIKSKYKILVLMDFSKSSYTVLKNALNLVKNIDGSIEIFHVKSAAKVVTSENQTTAMGQVYGQNNKIKQELEKLKKRILKEENIKIDCNFAIGNAKNEIKHHLKETNPDIVVIGKNKKRLIGFLGDRITQFLLHEYSGAIMISGDDGKTLNLNKTHSIGFFNDTLDSKNIEIIKDFIKETKISPKSFGTSNKSTSNVVKTIIEEAKVSITPQDIAEHEFGDRPNALDCLIHHASKSNLDIFCMGRGRKEENEMGSVIIKETEINKLIQKIPVPILIT